MDKNHKKDLEHILVKQTEKILHDMDPAATVIFTKYIKSHCKDLAKKFLKTQRKFQKQMEAISAGDNKPLSTVVKKEVTIPTSIPVTKKLVAKKEKASTAKLKTVAPKKTIKPRTRKGNNLINAAAIQKKAKATLVKNLNKTAKK